MGDFAHRGALVGRGGVAVEASAGPEPVGDDDDLGELVRGDDGAEAEPSEPGHGDQHADDEAGQHQVLDHDPPGAGGVVDDVGEVGEPVAHDRDVGGFDRDVGAGSAHGDADAGGGECGGVVDAVADHRHGAVLGEMFDGVGLVGGEEFGADVVDAGSAGERRGGGNVVAGEHRDAQYSPVQFADHVGGFVT